MIRVKVVVAMGLVGCRREAVIEVDAEPDDEEAIEEQARDAMMDMIDWHWELEDPD